MPELSLGDAQSVAQHALNDASARGFPVSVAVTDRHGNLVFFARQEGGTLGSVLSAQAKAFTAAAFGIDTAALFSVVAPAQPLHGLHTAAGPGRSFTPLPGAVALRDTADQLLGAIGIGGAPSPDLDHEIAADAAAHLGVRSDARRG
ncbi:MAG: hypothetical protein K0R68_2040 [Mycobacterium sp.]|nr:hypothetical protein [Mycobacterium sp.]